MASKRESPVWALCSEDVEIKQLKKFNTLGSLVRDYGKMRPVIIIA